jgi:hypothetical protein
LDSLDVSLKIKQNERNTNGKYFFHLAEILDTHFEKSCAKMALAEVTKDTQLQKSEPQREIVCPTCSQEFPLVSALDKEKYRVKWFFKHFICHS